MKLRIPRPRPRPISGRRLAPKIRMMMKRMTISSGIPRPIKTPSTADNLVDSITIVLVALFAASAAAGPAHAQFASGVSVVEVYATATDVRGQPVTDLAK